MKLSWGKNANGASIIKRLYKRKVKPVLYDNDKVCVNILYDSHHECLCITINLSNKNINDDAVYVIAFGLYNNATVKKLDLSINSINVNGMNKLLWCVSGPYH